MKMQAMVLYLSADIGRRTWLMAACTFLCFNSSQLRAWAGLVYYRSESVDVLH